MRAWPEHGRRCTAALPPASDAADFVIGRTCLDMECTQVRWSARRRRVIETVNGLVGLGAYAKAWRTAKAAPLRSIFPYSLCHWASATREQVLDEFSAGLHDRINRHVPGYGQGRRWNDEYESDLRRVARRLASRMRVYVEQVPTDVRARLAHRLAKPGDP